MGRASLQACVKLLYLDRRAGFSQRRIVIESFVTASSGAHHARGFVPAGPPPAEEEGVQSEPEVRSTRIHRVAGS
jgi:hypothetical protein